MLIISIYCSWCDQNRTKILPNVNSITVELLVFDGTLEDLRQPHTFGSSSMIPVFSYLFSVSIVLLSVGPSNTVNKEEYSNYIHDIDDNTNHTVMFMKHSNAHFNYYIPIDK